MKAKCFATIRTVLSCNYRILHVKVINCGFSNSIFPRCLKSEMRGLLLALLLYESVALECQVCTEGTFCFNDGNFSCPLHSTSQPQSGNITACVCQAGYYALSNHTCTRCPNTKFCPGDETIQSCPQFQETTVPLASSLSQCFCIQGYELKSGACQEFPQNSYKIQTGPLHTGHNDGFRQKST